MKGRIVLTGLTVLAISAIAYTGYQYAGVLSKAEKPVVKKIARSDSFAISEFIAVVRKYEKAKTIEADFITYVIGGDKNKVIESFEGKYVRDTSALYLKSYKSENLLNKLYLIAIDNEERVIYLERPDKNDRMPFFQGGFLYELDSLYSMQDSLITYEKLNEKTARLSIEISSENYSRTELIYDIITKEIKELRFYPYEDLFGYVPDEGIIDANGLKDLQENDPETKKEKDLKVSYIAVVYSKLTIDNPVNRKWFDEKRIFTQADNKFELKNQYKNYEIEIN